jgi:hypothetical protein
VPLEVEDGEATDVADAIDVDGELSEEVDDGRCAFGERKPEDKWSEDDGEEFGDKDLDFHREELAELVVDLD